MAIVRADALRSKAFGAITGSYTVLGAALAHLLRVFKLTNNTDGDLLISIDGTTDNFFLPAGSFTLYDLSTNSPPTMVIDNYFLGIGTQFYVKSSSSPTKGSVYLEGLYSKGD